MFQNCVGRLRSLSKCSSFKASYATEAVLQCATFKLHKLDQGPKSEFVFKKDESLKWLNQMHVIRRIEVTVANLYKAKLVRGLCHLYPGQEAVAVGIKSRMYPKDTSITSYRCHGWSYVNGCSPLGIIAELLGKQTGCAKGKGGSMHLYHDNFYGGNGIVAAQVPLGTGLALKHKYMDDEGCCVICYGDGASNQGQVFEAFNMAKLLNLPALYVIENNRYGMGTSDVRSSCNTSYYQRGDVIPGIWTDGMDIVSVQAAAEFARQHIKEGKGPILLETYTYRYHGHSTSDLDTYRSRDEIRNVRETIDPIDMFKKKLLEAALITEEEAIKVEDEAKVEVKSAVDKALRDQEISLEEIGTDIYAQNFEENIREVLFDSPEYKIRKVANNTKSKVLVRSHAMREEASPPREPTPTSQHSPRFKGGTGLTFSSSRNHSPISPYVVVSPSISRNGSPSRSSANLCISPTATLTPSPTLKHSPRTLSPHSDCTILQSEFIEVDGGSPKMLCNVSKTNGRREDLRVYRTDVIVEEDSSQRNCNGKKNECNCVSQNCNRCLKSQDRNFNNNLSSNINNNVVCSQNTLTVNRANLRGKLKQQSSSQGSFEGSLCNSPCLSRDNSSEQYFTDTTGVDLERFIPETLNKNAKDRALMLRIEQELVSLAKDDR
ncbi:pyruvate dehydrogenase e1 component alpha subunit bacterial and organellar [Holotrichia oblita]|uniref:Pyruvate dehydrogenase e1 component alpha subunit bacterial and organellar n=1 Tax=Holotrichia oblita TaxID=644536 RepID=A0ACB9TPC2_HOLOL|nr:pyruvate dehydrogenase e1 component alpha subunit bacterial and organellar [Holotrichia oblita]